MRRVPAAALVEPEDHPDGPWTEHDPYEGWPFRTSLPYCLVHASPDVAAGTAPVGTVLRDADGTWCFLEPGADRAAAEQVKLRDIVTAHPDVQEVAGLAPGERADRRPDGTWRTEN